MGLAYPARMSGDCNRPWRTGEQEKGPGSKGEAPGQGRKLPIGAACQNTFFACRADNCYTEEIICYIYIHEVAQALRNRWENNKVVWPLYGRSRRHVCHSRGSFVSNSHAIGQV